MDPLSTPWQNRKPRYDFIVIGSGYGGSIAAARLAKAMTPAGKSVCILERGKEWKLGEFPESLAHGLAETRSDTNPLGLYELLNHQDISIIKGSGLGGTSLINANVAIRPDREVFEEFHWPDAITFEELQPFYDRAQQMLGAGPHPRALQLAKVAALGKRAQEIGMQVQPLDIAVNFHDGVNAHGVHQKECIDCGNCVSGCNVGAKNTLAMNYLPVAKDAGAVILTQNKVEWLEKLPGGGWRVHGRHVEGFGHSEKFTFEAGEVILSAGALNSAEILLRSEMHGLSVSPALGTKFSGNGDFFGLAYNCDFETDTLGYAPAAQPGPGDSPAPGPSIVGLVRYANGQPQRQRIAIEDLSFPSLYTETIKTVFRLLPGERTVSGNEAAQLARSVADFNLFNHDRNGAMNHTMLYLVMGQDNARGVILFDKPFLEPDGKTRISWDKAGQQQIFTRMNEEIRRHAHALRGNFIANPTWRFFNLRHLVTAHPLGGCPMGDDYAQGAVDPFGRVFRGDGGVHDGLYVTDGSVIPSALGVNPFLTISAISERFVDRKIRQLGGEQYPQPNLQIGLGGIDPIEAIDYSEGELESLFRRAPTLGLDRFVNQGGNPVIDRAQHTIRNDRYWKGFFPHGHVLNAMSSAIFTGFKKEFHKEGNKYTGITSDTDGRIRARNSLEEITVTHRGGGTLEAGKYILLRYLDPPWQGFYDIFKMIHDDLLIGRVYVGSYPNGIRMFTFPMTRKYGFAHMTVDDHRTLYAEGTVPTAADLEGSWRMDTISNANQAGGLAYLHFSNKPDGRLEVHYDLLGVMEGLVTPAALSDHFQLTDFTQFHDEIRKVSDDLLIGKYVTTLPAEVAALVGNQSFGLFHAEPGGKFGFYYLLTKAGNELPSNLLLAPFLDVQLPDGVGLTFDEQMDGWYFPGHSTPAPGRAGDLTLDAFVPGAIACSFKVRMTVRDVNEFVDGYEHEALMTGSITFADFGGAPATFTMDAPASRFHYLRSNPATGEAEMNYHIEFASNGRRFVFEGVKYMQKDGSGRQTIQEVLNDYTTLYCHVFDDTKQEIGTAYLKFRTFENLAGIGSLAAFATSFQVIGTSDLATQFQARMRFLAFTSQFVIREYDPLAPIV